MSFSPPIGTRPVVAPPVAPSPRIPVNTRCIAFVDLETTGLDPARHEIVEIAVLRVDAFTLHVVGECSVLVRPERLDRADTAALAVCGFDEAAWKDAIPLREALTRVAPFLENTLVAGHNVGFDWSFLEAGFRRAGLALPEVDYHRLDTASLAWTLVAIGAIDSMSLDAVAGYFGLERPRPHRALADARCALDVARRMLDCFAVGDRVVELPGNERESFETLLDGLHGLAEAIVHHRRQEATRRCRVYVCHPFANDPAGNIERVRAIGQVLVAEGVLPIAPHLFIPQIVDEATDREHALALCLELLAACDEVQVFGDLVTEGMERELCEARRLGIRVRFVREVRA